jgi:hypothetical protein
VKIVLILLVTLSISCLTAQAQDTKLEKEVKKELKGELLDGNGKPANPGAKGRINSEVKKATNPGQGSGKDSGLTGALLDELDDDDKGKGSGKNKGKKKPKN